MGISSLPSPSDGMLCIILVNTALSISMVKGVIRSILGVFGVHLSSSDGLTDSPSEAIQYRSSPADTYIDEFRNRIPAIRFDSVCGCNPAECIDEQQNKHEHDCSVCLNEFEPESEINHLSCGHLFHKECLEKWLKYWNVTCPLCRNSLMPDDETPCIW